jgi:c-di-GMP-binding flagellar brake protein YcgR
MRERRIYVRSNGLVLVNYKIPELNFQGKSSAYDISGAGLCITVDKRIDTGVAIEMEVFLPGNSQPIIAKGKTVWIEDIKGKKQTAISTKKEYFNIGIEFTMMSENNKVRIVNYVRERLRQVKKQ